MKPQKERIRRDDWDVLLVLDACRFDVFRETCSSFLTGKLREVRSPASCTINWLKRTFNSFYGSTKYVSGSPYVNSRGVSREGWTAVDHFRRDNIIDVWDFGWKETEGTVLPESVADAARPVLENREDNERVIVHFMQPHAPYLSIDHSYSNREGKQREQEDFAVFKRLKRSLGPYVLRMMGMNSIFLLKSFLGMNPSIDGEEIWRELDMETWREAYRQNLLAVLKGLPTLLEGIEGQVVVTADHGEALGDNGIYMHPMGVNIPVLRNVPWFEVRDLKRDPGE